MSTQHQRPAAGAPIAAKETARVSCSELKQKSIIKNDKSLTVLPDIAYAPCLPPEHGEQGAPHPSGGEWRFNRPVWLIMKAKVTAGLPKVLKFTQKFSVCVRQITSFRMAMKTKK